MTKTNQLGFGAFELIPQKESSYFLMANHYESTAKWILPEISNTGFSMKIEDDRNRSLLVELNQKPAMPQDIYLLSTANGKVFSIHEKRLNGTSIKVDLPVQHLPGGVNTLIAMDQAGKIIAERSFFVNPPKLTIQLESAIFKSKRSNRVELTFRITDQNGAPIAAYLSAVGSATDPSNCVKCDLRSYIYFNSSAIPKSSVLTLKMTPFIR